MEQQYRLKMVWVKSPVYFYKRKDIYYFSRAVPSDFQHRFNKHKMEVSLRTKSATKAARSAAALSDKLERHWYRLRMEMIYSRELGLTVTPDVGLKRNTKLTLTDALALYQRLKGKDKAKLFFKTSHRSIRYLSECLGIFFGTNSFRLMLGVFVITFLNGVWLLVRLSGYFQPCAPS